MIGGVIVTHGRLGEALLESAQLIVGELVQTEAVSLLSGEGPDLCNEKIHSALTRVDSGQGAILFADLPGGTPCNVGLTCIADRDLEVVTGVNLSMLVKFPVLQDSARPLLDVARDLMAYGTRSIRVASESLRSRTDSGTP